LKLDVGSTGDRGSAVGRTRGPIECELPFDYWVFGRPISYRNEAEERPPGYPRWRAKVKTAAEEAADDLSKGRGFVLTTALVEVRVYWLTADPTDKTQPDLDNILKPLLDALVKLVIDDDRQVHRLIAEKGSINSMPVDLAHIKNEIVDDDRFVEDGEVTVVRVLNLAEG
jgi:Holliday junction resolvase RusA-like endonuclease